MIQRREPGTRTNLIFRIVAITTLVAAFGQVTLGGVVRVTGSGLGCPDWPLCHGQLVPPFEVATLIEYSHRLSGSVLGILIFATAGMAAVFYRNKPWILYSTFVGVAMVVVAGILGGITVLTELVWWVRLIHLGVAEIVVAAMVFAVVVGWKVTRKSQSNNAYMMESDRFNMQVLITLAGVFFLILSGSYIVGYGVGSSCTTWPLCRGSLFPDGTPYAIHMGHRYLAGLIGALVVWTAVSAWSRRAERPELGWAAVILVIAFAIQIFTGAATVLAGFTEETRAIHLSLATLVWIALVFLSALVYTPQQFAIFGAIKSTAQGTPELERLRP